MQLIQIHDDNVLQYIDTPVIDGELKSKGLVQRDPTTHPLGCYARGPAFDMPLIPESEYQERIEAMDRSESSLLDIRMRGMYGKPMPSRDQNGRGYCWKHSGTSATLLVRARDNQSYVDLSAYAGACIMKDYRDEGGWGAAGLDYSIEFGDPDSKYWPQKSTDPANDTPEMRANALLHRVSESWMDISVGPYDRRLTYAQVITCLLERIPVIGDFNWWGHSVCLVKPIRGSTQRTITRSSTGKVLPLAIFDRIWGMNDPVLRGIGVKIWNSWGDGWSEIGMGDLSGQKAIPDSACAPRVVRASAA